MTQLATAEDVEAVLGSPVDPTTADRLSEMASAVVERYCRRGFSLVEDDEIVVSVTDGVLRLPAPPVVEVTSIVDPDGSTVDPDTYTVTLASGLVTLDWTTVDWCPPFHTRGWACGDYEITYTHGYDPVPDDVVFVVASMVARQITNPQGYSSETLGDYSFTGASGGLTISADDKALLGPYKRRSFSVPMAR